MADLGIRAKVRESYARVARQRGSCCGPSRPAGASPRADSVAKAIGYTPEELSQVPEGANLGLGCGNPVALASLREGEVVLDLGSGAGVDCFLAATRVGGSGRVIGVDMTPEMVDRARENARRGSFAHVEFRLGEIEHLPVADGSVDAVISNCVINLSPDKGQVFQEAFRALKPGGRLFVSDIVLLKALPEAIMSSLEAYAGCVAGAALKGDYLGMIQEAGFRDVRILGETSFHIGLLSDPTVQATVQELRVSPKELEGLAGSAVSITVQAIKPNQNQPDR